MTLRLLFLCTGNSCRSQMAEGWARHLGRGRVDAFSAGTAPKGLHPLAVKAMGEVGIDISGQSSKHVDAFDGQRFDFAITVCDRAKESCPLRPGSTMVHWSFDDPAEATGSEEEKLEVFRRVREEIRHRIALFLDAQRPG
jgi:arsenate reductase